MVDRRSPSRRVTFLLNEANGYFKAAIDHLAQYYGHEVLVIAHDPTREAPFERREMGGTPVISRGSLSDCGVVSRVAEFSPNLIFVAGWTDRGYLAAANRLQRSAVSVLALDNQWRGTLRQYLGSLWVRAARYRYPQFAWVPGVPQVEFARRLGFAADRIRTGLYPGAVKNPLAETGVFEDGVDKRFIFVGRYVEHKGIVILVEAFRRASSLRPGWELVCVGTGTLARRLPLVPGVRHLGFVQPEQMPDIFRMRGVFVLPSTFEPWGVVLQEFASSGHPLISTTAVGAATQFLVDGINGRLVEAGNVQDLCNALVDFMGKTATELREMAHESTRVGKEPNVQTWCEVVCELAGLDPASVSS